MLLGAHENVLQKLPSPLKYILLTAMLCLSLHTSLNMLMNEEHHSHVIAATTAPSTTTTPITGRPLNNYLT